MFHTHSCHVVLQYSNLFFTSTCVFHVVINSMCETRETLDMVILGDLLTLINGKSPQFQDPSITTEKMFVGPKFP